MVPEWTSSKGRVFLEDGILRGFDEGARSLAAAQGVSATVAENKLIAPCLVDPIPSWRPL